MYLRLRSIVLAPSCSHTSGVLVVSITSATQWARADEKPVAVKQNGLVSSGFWIALGQILYSADVSYESEFICCRECHN